MSREVLPEEVGGSLGAVRQPALAVVRDGRTLPFDHPECTTLEAGDRLIVVRSSPRLRGASKDKDGDEAGASGR